MKRLAYIDWMRGLACLLMFQTHCYDSWLSPEARKTGFFSDSQLGGTLPAPLFIFLAGISVALATERLREKGKERGEIAVQVMRRGAEVFGLGVLFRVQEYILGIPRSPWTDLLRVDVLNTLGLSMVLMGMMCWLVGAGGAAELRVRSLSAAVACAVVVAVATPWLWTSWRPRFLPWPIESYVNGVHTFDTPQVWLFPVFPWVAFAFAGLATGFCLFTDFAKRSEAAAFALVGVGGMVAIAASDAFDRWGVRLYRVYDYWHTSPNFFLARCGILLLILSFAYVWCRWGLGQVGFSPLVQLGQTSLLVYWVHIEFVYGRFSILPKRQCGIALATAGLCLIFWGMLALSLARTAWEKRRAQSNRLKVSGVIE